MDPPADPPPVLTWTGPIRYLLVRKVFALSFPNEPEFLFESNTDEAFEHAALGSGRV